MSETLPPPTAEARRLVQCIGPEAALALIEARGGTWVYVAKGTSHLADIIGEDGARALSTAFGGLNFKVPLARTWRVLIYHARGMTQPAIALKVGCSVDGVSRILSRHGLTSKQYDLFSA